jgi:probable rRNA maturation factor
VTKAGRQFAVQIASRLAGIPSPTRFRRWLGAAIAQPATLTLRVVNAAEGRNLNSAFRGKDYATDVLTFVYHAPGDPMLHGDIVLCAPVVRREAREQGKRLVDHYAHLTIHGALHLMGMEHEKPREAKRMEARETELLAAFGIADPYSG